MHKLDGNRRRALRGAALALAALVAIGAAPALADGGRHWWRDGHGHWRHNGEQWRHDRHWRDDGGWRHGDRHWRHRDGWRSDRWRWHGDRDRWDDADWRWHRDDWRWRHGDRRWDGDVRWRRDWHSHRHGPPALVYVPGRGGVRFVEPRWREQFALPPFYLNRGLTYDYRPPAYFARPSLNIVVPLK